jgi:hypothetical protein
MLTPKKGEGGRAQRRTTPSLIWIGYQSQCSAPSGTLTQACFLAS